MDLERALADRDAAVVEQQHHRDDRAGLHDVRVARRQGPAFDEAAVRLGSGLDGLQVLVEVAGVTHGIDDVSDFHEGSPTILD